MFSLRNLGVLTLQVVALCMLALPFGHVNCELCDSRVLNRVWAVRRCGCPTDEAQKGDLCVKCHELNWNCSEPGLECRAQGSTVHLAFNRFKTRVCTTTVGRRSAGLEGSVNGFR